MSAQSFSPLLETLLAGEHLTEQQAGSLMSALADDALPAAMAGALLAALRAKGETADEIRGFANVMRERALRPDIDLPLADGGYRRYRR